MTHHQWLGFKTQGAQSPECYAGCPPGLQLLLGKAGKLGVGKVTSEGHLVTRQRVSPYKEARLALPVLTDAPNRCST